MGKLLIPWGSLLAVGPSSLGSLMCPHTNLYGCRCTGLRDCTAAQKSMLNKPNTEPPISKLSVSFKSDRCGCCEAAARLSWSYLSTRNLSLWSLSANWLAFSGSDPDVWCKTQTPHIKGNWGVGEWISILEEILTLGIEVMSHPAFRILCDIIESKNWSCFFSPHLRWMKC